MTLPPCHLRDITHVPATPAPPHPARVLVSHACLLAHPRRPGSSPPASAAWSCLSSSRSVPPSPARTPALSALLRPRPPRHTSPASWPPALEEAVRPEEAVWPPVLRLLESLQLQAATATSPWPFSTRRRAARLACTVRRCVSQLLHRAAGAPRYP